jgi:ParB family transcriptional regulator, chromosome partitioning protein
MNKRRDALKAMMAPITAPPMFGERQSSKTSGNAGPLKAMGLSLQSLSDEADEARLLREQLAAGARVVELDPTLIDPSFIRDRLDDPNAADFDAFQASIAEHGQQVPILVRPSAHSQGRYQVAYGHRRLEALQRLRRPVKAIVRQLTDEELVVAQGKENLERRDLSFIERALFAARLEDRGFARSALVAALAVHKGNLSTMITVARSVPEQLILAIGAAPKIGRPRWELLSEMLSRSGEKWRQAIASAGFDRLDSDARFARVLKALTPPLERTAGQVVKDHDGTSVARVMQGKGNLRLTIDERSTPEFGAYLIERLPEIYAAFRRRADA